MLNNSCTFDLVKQAIGIANKLNINIILCISAVVVLMVACKDKDHNYQFKMNRVNLNGAKYLALAGPGGTDRGVSHLESQTAANNNVVISTLIPLN